MSHIFYGMFVFVILDTSNWMRFVQLANAHTEQNLVVVEIESALYFINKENILPKQELKVK